MKNRLLGWLTINQMLFVSHLVLVLSIIVGMSYTRYQSDWQSKVEHLAEISASHLEAYNTFFSGSVAGRNYANLLMQSTLDDLKAIPNLIFAEISGTSDYSGQEVTIRYSIEQSRGWRLDVSEQDQALLADKLSNLESLLATTPASKEVQIKKLNYLINKVRTDLEVVADHIRLQSLPSPYAYDQVRSRDYYLDEENQQLHLQVNLRNENGGLFRVVVDATELEQIKSELLANVIIEAFIAIVISFLLILLITHWLVSPLKQLADSMKQDIEKIDQTKLPEIKRADEIGELARAYSSLITRIKNQLRFLHQQTETDPLTGIGSRLKYQKRAAEVVQAALKKQEFIYLALCDIDNFKRFNDSYGHTEGDNTLAEVANQMNNTLKPNELGCRLGGEEFVFLLVGKNNELLRNRVEELRDVVQQLKIPHKGNAPHGLVTVSIGADQIVANGSLATIEQSEQLLQSALQNADKQLYVGKETGRNKVLFS